MTGAAPEELSCSSPARAGQGGSGDRTADPRRAEAGPKGQEPGPGRGGTGSPEEGDTGAGWQLREKEGRGGRGAAWQKPLSVLGVAGPTHRRASEQRHEDWGRRERQPGPGQDADWGGRAQTSAAPLGLRSRPSPLEIFALYP